MSTVTFKPYKQSSRGFELLIQAPASVTDFDAHVGEGACLGHAIAEGVYRSILPKVWKKFMETAPAVFGVAIEKIGTKENKRNPEAGPTDVFEGIDTYLPKVKAQAEADGRTAELKSFVQNIANEVGFDLERTGRSRKAAPVFYDKAKELIEKVARGETTWERVVANTAARGATTPIEFDEAGAVKLDSLAMAVQEALTADTGLA